MKKKYLKIVGFTLLVTSSETENPYYPCVPALGFCFINGIQISKVAIID